SQQAIVTSIAALARTLGIVVVAEGVENAAQLDFVRSLGCPLVQGRVFADPSDPAALRAGGWLDPARLRGDAVDALG
ncbi:MAG: EAL domain-containing protein, partial [Trueperaceae bacterium]